MIRQYRSLHHKSANLPSSGRKRKALRGRRVQLEKLEKRELLAQLSTGTGEGNLQVWVNEYGAFGRSGDLDVAFPLNPQGPREVNDAFYDPIGVLSSAGTVFESGLAIQVGTDPVQFLTAGTIANSPPPTNATSSGSTNGRFIGNTQSLTTLTSVFYYPSTALADGTGAQIKFTLTQQVIPVFLSGTAPISVTLRQSYSMENLTGADLNVQVWRYLDGDLLFQNGSFLNDGGGSRQIQQGQPERVWMTNVATNSNKNDPTYLEVRRDDVGVLPTDRWEVGLGRGAVRTNLNTACTTANPCKNQPNLPPNGALVDKILNGTALADDIIPTTSDIDSNNAVDNTSPNDWATALKNFYILRGGANPLVYVTETQWGNPPIGDPDPPVTPSPTLGNVLGVVYHDRDGDGTRDPEDNGLQGWRVYADLNGNGALDAFEPSTVSGTGGGYNLQLALGNYTIREIPQANWTLTEPAGGSYSVSLTTAGQVIPNENFGNFPTPGSISGQVFEDLNRSGRLELGEPGLGTVVVYVDYNNNGALDPTEPSATSAAGTGTYTITNVVPGQFAVRQVVPGGYYQTFPTNNAAQVVSLQPAGAIGGVNFGDSLRDGSVGGKVYLDVNHNGVIDPGEPGLGGVIVWVDRDNDGKIGLGENAVTTGADGTFGLLGIRPGTYPVRMALPAGYVEVIPGATGNIPGAITVTVAPGVATIDALFLADQVASVGPDFGDAPAPYPTTLAQNGARHVVVNNFGLGAFRDGEGDGQPTVGAVGDDNNSLDDEDGIEWMTPLVPGQVAVVRVTVSTGGRYPGLLQGFIDFNGTNAWNDASDRIILDRQLVGGAYEISFLVPATAKPGLTYARFRYGYEHGLGPTGSSIAGEVEDYAVMIVGPTPTANNDTFDIISAGMTIPLDVLANDIASSSGDLTIVSVDPITPPGTINGTVTIAADGRSLDYIPSGNAAFDTFTYTVEDPAGNQATATVTINIKITPTAVDDLFLNVPQNTSTTFNLATQIFVNDIAGAGTLSLFGNPTAIVSQGGTLVPNAAGTGLVYTPATNFAGTEQFSYTVINGSGLTASATITIQVTPGNANNQVSFDVSVLKTDGSALTTPIGLGQQFLVQVTTKDLRPNPVPNPISGIDVRGVYAAYLDLLFDRSRVVPVADAANPFGFDITFGAAYGEALQGNTNTPSLIDEVGASFVGTTPPVVGGTSVILFTIRYVVLPSAPNGVANFLTDPSDKPANAVLISDPNAPNGVVIVGVNQIALDSASVTIDSSVPVSNPSAPNPEPGGSSGTGSGTGTGGTTPVTGSGIHRNAALPTDVNNDHLVSPLDVLLIINALNTQGPRSLVNVTDPRVTSSPMFFDVNGDDLLSPLDALMVINQLNARSPSGEASGEDTSAALPESASVKVTLPANSSVVLPTTETNVSQGASTALADDLVDDLVDTSAFDSSLSTRPQDYAFVNSMATDFGSSFGSTAKGDDEDLESILEDLA